MSIIKTCLTMLLLAMSTIAHTFEPPEMDKVKKILDEALGIINRVELRRGCSDFMENRWYEQEDIGSIKLSRVYFDNEFRSSEDKKPCRSKIFGHEIEVELISVKPVKCFSMGKNGSVYCSGQVEFDCRVVQMGDVAAIKKYTREAGVIGCDAIERISELSTTLPGYGGEMVVDTVNSKLMTLRLLSNGLERSYDHFY